MSFNGEPDKEAPPCTPQMRDGRLALAWSCFSKRAVTNWKPLELSSVLLPGGTRILKSERRKRNVGVWHVRVQFVIGDRRASKRSDVISATMIPIFSSLVFTRSSILGNPKDEMQFPRPNEKKIILSLRETYTKRCPKQQLDCVAITRVMLLNESSTRLS